MSTFESPSITYEKAESKLTDYELDALSRHFNFADGHARYSIIQNYASLPETFSHLLTRTYDQEEAEFTFAQAFFGMSGQTLLEAERILYCPSASVSIEIVANYLRMNNLSVSLIEPIFDNLADCIKRHQVELKPLPEDFLYEQDTANWHRMIETEAIFLVIPNNPTGYLLSPSFFAQIVDFCVREKKLLIVDFSFRFFAPELQQWDQYRLLEQSGVQYILIEDTGKTWPTFEIKVGPLVADRQTFPAICSIYRDIFICHSPLALTLVGAFVKASQTQGTLTCFQEIVAENRLQLRKAIANTPLKPLSHPLASVEWIRIEEAMDDLELVHRLQSFGVHILPGKQFFWSKDHESSQFVRVALMRDTDVFARGMQVLQQAIPAVFDGRKS